MTPNEFKAWFDGFTEAFEGRIPTKAQWGRIKDRVAEIDGKSVTHTVYVDRYVRPYPYLGYPWATIVGGVCNSYAGNAVGQAYTANAVQSGASNGSNQIASNQIANLGPSQQFNSIQAMNDLGRAEAATLAA